MKWLMDKIYRLKVLYLWWKLNRMMKDMTPVQKSFTELEIEKITKGVVSFKE